MQIEKITMHLEMRDMMQTRVRNKINDSIKSGEKL
jgi:hypothetical protein